MSAEEKAKLPRGRPVGAKAKTPTSVKENIICVFTRMGGTAEMAKWARKNPTDFYKIYAKLLPMQVTGENGDPIRLSIENAKSSLITKLSVIVARIGEDKAP